MSPRPLSWWACEFAGLLSLVLFFYAMAHVLAWLAPERMHFQ